MFQKAASVNKKSTLRLYVGWKHMDNSKFKLISASKGGGQWKIDVERHANLNQLATTIKTIYFPDGLNRETGLYIKDLEEYVATFSGQELKNTLQTRSLFTVEKFVSMYPFHPVRIYLHTCLMKEVRFQHLLSYKLYA